MMMMALIRNKIMELIEFFGTIDHESLVFLCERKYELHNLMVLWAFMLSFTGVLMMIPNVYQLQFEIRKGGRGVVTTIPSFVRCIRAKRT